MSNPIETVFPNAAQISRMNGYLKEIAVALKGGSLAEDDIADIIANVRAGLGPELYPVGTIINIPEYNSATVAVQGTGVTAATVDGHAFCEAKGNAAGGVYVLTFSGAWEMSGRYVNPTDYGLAITGTPVVGDKLVVTITSNDRAYVVAQHNGYATIPAAPHMTLVAVDVIYGRPLDDQEAFLCAEAAIPAGTYNFTIPETVGSWPAGTYQFTTTAEHPAGSLFRISGQWNTALTSLKVNVFHGAGDASASEACVITSGSGGTSLGTFGTELNHTHRAAYGSNNYAQSNIRQFINSEAAGGAYLVKKTKYDMYNGTYRTLAGFLRNFGRDLKDALLSTELTLATNNIFEIDYTTGSSYTIKDKVFLLSMTELGWGNNNNIAEGSLLDLYVGASNADRIKYDISSGVARYWWLRSCYPGSAYLGRFVYADGSLHIYGALYGLGLVPAFNIG